MYQGPKLPLVTLKWLMVCVLPAGSAIASWAGLQLLPGPVLARIRHRGTIKCIAAGSQHVVNFREASTNLYSLADFRLKFRPVIENSLKKRGNFRACFSILDDT